MNEQMRKGLRLVLLICFAVSSVLLLGQVLDKRSGSRTYDAALTVALQEKAAETRPETTLPETADNRNIWVPEPAEDDPVMAQMEKINLAALQEVNPDVIGWIRIPDTKIDYPVLQGPDNEFYLKRTWEKEENHVGSVFLEHRNSQDMMDFNTILYAHNMNDGSMFGGLSKYNDSSYRQKHPYVYIATSDRVLRYEIFAFYKAEVESPTYGLSFQQVQTKVDFVKHALEKSHYDTGIVPENHDRVLTLSTCTAAGISYRWVAQARLKMVEVQP